MGVFCVRLHVAKKFDRFQTLRNNLQQHETRVKQGSKGWRSSESTRLPMWPGYKSRRRRHMWVEFVVGSLIFSERFFSGNPDFPSPQKPTIPNSNSIWNARTRLNEFIRTLKCFVGKQITKSYKLHATGCANERKMLGLVGQRCCVRLHGAKAHW